MTRLNVVGLLVTVALAALLSVAGYLAVGPVARLSEASDANGSIPVVKSDPALTLTASYTTRSYRLTSGLILLTHMSPSTAAATRVRIGGVLARGYDRNHIGQFWLVGTKENGLPPGYFKIHRDYLVTFKLCAKNKRCLTTTKSMYVH